jgi:hypothetical protein
VTEPTPDQEVFTRAGALTGALGGVRDELKALRDRLAEQENLQTALAEAQDAQVTAHESQVKYEKRSRVLLLLAFVVTAVAITAVAIAIRASSQAAVAKASAAVSHRIASAQHSDLLAGCQAGNQAKLQQKSLWAFVESAIAPRPGSTAAQLAAGERFESALKAHVQMANPIRNCQVVYSIQPPAPKAP